MIISQFPAGTGGSASGLPKFSFTGKYIQELDGGGWKISFLTSGDLIFYKNAEIDIFAVGGGGEGYRLQRTVTNSNLGDNLDQKMYGAGGGGGYTITRKNHTVTPGKTYTITVGDSSEDTEITLEDSDFSVIAGHGNDASFQSGSAVGGDGGSGGAGSGFAITYKNTGAWYSGNKELQGGTDGGDGKYRYVGSHGTGQGTTTREFGTPDGKLYASGGMSISQYAEIPEAPKPNTGDGGCGGYVAQSGASGIVIIRNARGVSE